MATSSPSPAPADADPDLPGIEPASRWIDSQGHRLHYVDWGNPDAPPLVLVHGAQDHCRNWDRIANRLRHDWHIIAPDLRGHGDSQWTTDGIYSLEGYLYDLTQLIDRLDLAPVTLIAHSLGGRIALRYAGIYPENVNAVVAIEGLGPPPSKLAEEAATPIATRMRKWMADYRKLAERSPRRYASLDEAAARLQEQHAHLGAPLVRHLTVTGTRQNEDGTFSWKFDNRSRLMAPFEMSIADREAAWMNIACPLLLLHGMNSFAPDPTIEHRDRQFRHARLELVENAGHWVHHEQFERFMELTVAFLDETAKVPQD